MMLPHGTIVAIADGATLRLLRNGGTETDLDLVEFSHPSIVPTNPGSGSRHHSSSANPDSHRKEEDGFAAATANQLNRLALEETPEHLFLIADSRTLGELRKRFHVTLQRKIIGELAKDLTGHPLHDIVTAIRNA